MSAVLQFDPGALVARLDREPFTIRHHLSGDRLFELDRLRRLCERLPRAHVEYNGADVPESQPDPDAVPRTGLSPEESIERIAEVPSWVVLKYVEQDPAYDALLRRCLDEVRPWSEAVSPGMGRPESFIFISSASSVTPFHMDPEVNFLLQIRGHKQVNVFSPSDREVVPEAALERFYGGAHRNLPLPEHARARATCFDIGPGDAVHIPVTAPHWVKVAGEVSVSYSVTWRTDASTRRAGVYAINHRLRRARLRPRPYGTSHLADQAKFNLYRAAARLNLIR